jgi:hypothetical protein
MAKICQAFRHHDLKPCGMRCHGDSDTCIQHRDFYDKSIWKHRFLNLENKRYLLQGIDCAANSFVRRIQHVIEFSLNSGKIVLTEPEIMLLPSVPLQNWNLPHNSLTDLFTVMCGTGKVMPSWNKNILRHAVYDYFKMYTNQALLDYVPSMEGRLGRLLANPATSPAEIFPIFSEYFNKRLLMRNDPVWRGIVHDRHQRFIKEALALPQMRECLLLSDEMIASYFFKWPPLMMDEFWASWIKEKRAPRKVNPTERLTLSFSQMGRTLAPLVRPYRDAEKARHKTLVAQYKEGFAMAVWHPKNVERWLNIGGWPLVASIAGDEGLV